jgi:hypothetical protein
MMGSSAPNLPRRTRAGLALVVVALLAGCATMQPPKPWEKGVLARPEMQFDADPMNARLTDHIYTSKEAASGGYGVGGGGCGCN